jgi:hypothetical protein
MQEDLATQGIVSAVQKLSDEFLRATDLEARVRRRPFTACAVAAGAGFLFGPRLLPRLMHLGVLAGAGKSYLLLQRAPMLRGRITSALRSRGWL